MRKLLIVFLIVGNLVFPQKFEKLALTPPMGWNSWNTFGMNINEKVIKEVADAMVEYGLLDAGYEYVVIDDGWANERDSLGFIVPDPKKFPSGMKALADYVYSKGLKFGIYSCAGWKTCGGRPGSRGYEFQDAIKYAEWGVDYLKYDWCYTDSRDAKDAYTIMKNALFKAGRPIVFSICEWGTNKPWEWAKDIGHLWRTTGDIIKDNPSFDGVVNHGSWKSWGVMRIADMTEPLRQYAGPDHWNDPDMLVVGMGMTEAEDRAHFSLWCMMAAPLFAGNDVRNMSQTTIEILTNKEVIAVDQDSLGIPGFRFRQENGIEVWYRPLNDEDWAVLFLNRSLETKDIFWDWRKNYTWDGISQRSFDCNKTTYSIRDLWEHKNIGTTEKPFRRKLISHGVAMLRLIHEK